MQKNIYVTQPSLPPLEEFLPYLEEIWDKKVLTNGGPFHQQLEKALCEYLGVEYISLFTNGTIALVAALQALKLTGEVITTPYSFVATTHSLLWNGIMPVFVDIDPETFNMDPAKIEAAITDKTTAILPVHCYGNPCLVEEIEEIAKKHNLKVIYDAAHAFGVSRKGKSVLNFGDLSVLSFHATKVFNTFEGGAIVSPTAQMKKRIDQLKNFGFMDEVTVVEPGINGKMSELNAAFGLLQLKHLDNNLSQRRRIVELYDQSLKGITGLKTIQLDSGIFQNYSYYPVLINDQFKMTRDDLYEKMKEQGIFARRYFYPLISEFPMYRDFVSARGKNLKQSFEISRQVLCLPLSSNMSTEDVERVLNSIKDA